MCTQRRYIFAIVFVISNDSASMALVSLKKSRSEATNNIIWRNKQWELARAVSEAWNRRIVMVEKHMRFGR